MKKIFCVALSIAMACAVSACGGSGSDNSGSTAESTAVESTAVESTAAESTAAKPSGSEWTREGYYVNEDGDSLAVYVSELEGFEGWNVNCMIGEDSYGNVIQEENGKLHGDLIPDYEEGNFIVTVSEEGEDGLLLEVEGGESYHFSPAEVSESAASIAVTINTEGLGYIAYARDGEEIGSEEDFQYTSSQLNLEEPETITIAAKADEDWVFSKWTKNGEDYSTDPQVTVECSESVVYVAVFEFAE